MVIKVENVITTMAKNKGVNFIKVRNYKKTELVVVLNSMVNQPPFVKGGDVIGIWKVKHK